MVNKIELLLAHKDHTWTTDIFDIPANIDREDENAVATWATSLYAQERFRKTVFFGVYNTNPEADTDDPRIEECVRCETTLTEDGRCGDETCPFSDTDQDDERGWAGHPDRDKG